MLHFNNPEYLILLAFIPGLYLFYTKIVSKTESTYRFSNLGIIREITGERHRWKRLFILGLRYLVVVLLIIAMARPQSSIKGREFKTEGIDIILVLDISSSMRAIDFKPNRLEAAKSVAKDFILSRHGDRIGLIVFASESFLQCPATIDYDVLLNLLQEVSIIPERFDGTAIGMAIANAVNRLRDLDAKSKVVILLSDGRNNAGELDPLTAADIAKDFGIRIYTIGAGKKGKAMFPMGGNRFMPVEVDIDEDVLTEIANRTGGKYFRAEDEKSLAEIYQEIGEMEKTEIKVKEYVNYAELYNYFLLPAFLVFLIEIILSRTRMRKIP